MELHFITSISKEYWESTGKICIPTWKLPGKVTVFVEYKEGPIEWMKEIPFPVSILHVPALKVDDEFIDRKKVLKFWGKACAQLTAVKNREIDERVIWIDADVEQISDEVSPELFDFTFSSPIAMMNSNDGEDCWETGVVVFNQNCDKLGIAMKKYEQAWKDDSILGSLWRPYDAQVLGHVALERGYTNLCLNPCKNIDALKNTAYKDYFKHWINKDNKAVLRKNHAKDSNNIS